MIELKVFYCLFLLSFLDSTSQIRPSLHGHNNAFVQDDNDVQYLLDNIPLPMHKDFTNTVHGVGDSAPDEDKIQDALSHIYFEPHVLDFKERQLGIPHQETVMLINKDHNRTIHLLSISGNTRHFHSSFFQDKVIPPLGNTTFNVIFLGREEGEVDTHLFIHTSEGTIKYQVRGISISSPYRLRPVIDVKLPLNASFTPLIYMHNPHPESLQVVEIYSSGGEFQLELPSGEEEGSRELWEIPPYQTKPVIRLHFNAYTEKNHTAYIRVKVNNTAEILIVAVEVEVRSGAGLHWGGSSGRINFGMGGSLQPPTYHIIALKNSAKKPVKVVNIISTPISKALGLQFKPTVIPGDTDIPIAIGTLFYDWKAGLELQHFKGKLMIKAIGPGGSSQKLAIPWVARVLQGGLEVNASITHYCSLQTSQAQNFSVVNKFTLPLAITHVTMSPNVKSRFMIKNFTPRVIKPEEKVNIFSLQLTKEKKSEDVEMESSILIHSNVSVTKVPLLSYDGKVRKIVPGEREDDKGTMNFGTVSSGTENEAIFALENQNPVNIELHDWGVNMPGAVLELIGCQSGPADSLDEELKNVTVCSNTGNQFIKPGFLAIFKIIVKSPMMEEDAIVGDVFVRTKYEKFILPVFMRVAHGKISVKKIIFIDCFPGSICVHQVKVHSTFTRPMEVTEIVSVNKDYSIKYIPLEEATLPTISKGDNYIGTIKLDPSRNCKQRCYLELLLETNAGSQWLNAMSLPSHTHNIDLNLLTTRYMRLINSTEEGLWDNITMRLDTSEVRGYKFYINIKPHWPSLLTLFGNTNKNKSIIMFPLTQVGYTSHKKIRLYNPSKNPLIVQVVMDWNYPEGSKLFDSLPSEFKPICTECLSTVEGEFKLENNLEERDLFEKKWRVTVDSQSFPFYLRPFEFKTIKILYTPKSESPSSALVYIRNNMTILEILRVMGHGAHAQFRFGNRKPGSTTPLLFEVGDKHLKDCERDRSKRNTIPNVTVKRTFTARNTGELPIHIYGFYISGSHCEGYGFKVLNCASFTLLPNFTKKIEIAFTPDFTLSRIERKLLILSSLGTESESSMIKLNLLATLPTYSLEPCAAILIRPSWEHVIHWAAVILSSLLLISVLAVSFLEADRILRGAFANFTRESSVQPPLDLRLLSHVPVQSADVANSSKEKPTNDDKNKINKKEEITSEWMLLNTKRCKDKDLQKNLKISGWMSEEEQRFKLDTESKDLLSFKPCEDPLDGPSNIGNIGLGTRKRNNNKKQQNVQESQSDNNCLIDNTFTEIQPVQEKKYRAHSLIKSSPVINRKMKSNNVGNVKEELKSCENEGQGDTNTIYLNTKNNKSENKRKQIAGGNSTSHNSNHMLKKLEISSQQKNVQLSEEETSSTTTESSVHDDTTSLCKGHDQNCIKTDKLQRKPANKKNKSQTIPSIPCVDYKDNYEGDCDDDEYDKDRHNNPNRWKINTSRSNAKYHIHGSRTVESSYKLPRQSKTLPRKEKVSQKRRVTDKIHTKTSPLNENINSKEDGPRNLGTVSTISSPPPPSGWGEHRAKFSDVVARNQESISAYSNLSNLHKNQTVTHNLSLEFTNDNKDTEYMKKQKPNKETIESTKEYEVKPEVVTPCISSTGRKKLVSQDITAQTNVSHANSYFINNFLDSSIERELVPYDDLPETDEPLVELEKQEENIQSQLWDDNSTITDLLLDNTNLFQFASSNSIENSTNLTESLKDNWVNVETNWEPLYTRTAVGEERSGVWGVNTGGVWAAAPWGATTYPHTLSVPLQLSQSHMRDRTGFDPFRSLNTIWTPSSTESWNKKHED